MQRRRFKRLMALFPNSQLESFPRVKTSKYYFCQQVPFKKSVSAVVGHRTSFNLQTDLMLRHSGHITMDCLPDCDGCSQCHAQDTIADEDIVASGPSYANEKDARVGGHRERQWTLRRRRVTSLVLTFPNRSPQTGHTCLCKCRGGSMSTRFATASCHRSSNHRHHRNP
jgi:hypothetical protein